MNTDTEHGNKMKMLYILNTTSKVNSFSYSSMVAAKEQGIEFHIAGNWTGYSDPEVKQRDESEYGIKIHQIDFIRTPYHPGNRKAYKQLKKLVETEKYDVIHCNTPIGGVLGRLVGKKCKVSKVIYEAHGFHFYKGAPKKNWLIYYPIEKWLARYTDALITMNQEDNEIAKQKLKLRNKGRVYSVAGVGIDLTQYNYERNQCLRSAVGVGENDIMLISAGDLIERKNYKVAIKAISEAKADNLKYCICGTGPQKEELEKYAESLGVKDKVIFLGFRTDMKELLASSDVFLFTTLQEGLPRSTMEAMASGLPCVVSKVRGNVDLVQDGNGGFLCDVMNSSEFAKAIDKLADDPKLCKQFGEINRTRIIDFSVPVVKEQLMEIYKSELGL